MKADAPCDGLTPPSSLSLIHTCELNRVNPFDYLMAFEQHAKAVANAPTCWFPWNYQHAIEAASSG